MFRNYFENYETEPEEGNNNTDSSSQQQTQSPVSLHTTNHDNSNLPVTDTFWYAHMDPPNFATFVTLVSWLVVITSGTGVELFFLCNIILYTTIRVLVTPNGNPLAVCPIRLIGCQGMALHENPPCPLLTVLLKVYAGLYNRGRIADLINGLGNLLHHISVALSVCLFCAGLPRQT